MAVRGEVIVAFIDRVDAGRRLAARLEHLRGGSVVVVGLPQGGVPVAYEVAKALDAPLDVIVVHKLGVPLQPELGMGSIGEDGVRIVNDEVVRTAGVSASELASVEARERAELERRVRRYRGDRPRTTLEGRTVVVVDDGVATGSTARAACQVVRAQRAARVVLAVPVAPPGWKARLDSGADEFVCLERPEPFYAIGQSYDDFSQTTDQEVIGCLERATRPLADVSSVVLDLNRQAQAQLRCENRLNVVSGATHLFEEPGTLEVAAESARDWFTGHLVAAPSVP
jgi:putative phosphoribosyl transferase